MIKVLDSANTTLSILDKAYDASLLEEINGEFTFNFYAPIDGTKSADIYHGHKIEVEDNYFNIMKTISSRNDNGIYIAATCEHVSYDFNNVSYTAYSYTGEASAALSALINDVNTQLTANFTLGTVEITSNETLSVDEEVTARTVLMDFAALYEGELSFNKYEISLLTRRGADRGVQFRYRKNLSDASVTVDYQTLDDDGNPTVTYAVDVAELEFEQNYIDKGYSDLEHYELGDTIHVIDEDLGIDTSARIVKYTYNPLQRMQGTVEIGDYINDITDTLTEIVTTTVGKDSVYNGCSIGPTNGFVAERSDAIAKTTMNATDGIKIQLKPTATSSYTAVFYVEYDTATATAQLYLAGDAVFAGSLEAADGTFSGTLDAVDGTFSGTLDAVDGTFTGTLSGVDGSFTGTIAIGSGDDIFKANGTDGIWLGDATFDDAPFSVTLSGAVTASNLTMNGGSINWSSVSDNGAYSLANSAKTIAENIADGNYSGGTFIDETSIYSPTILASWFNVVPEDFSGSLPSTITAGTTTYSQGLRMFGEFSGSYNHEYLDIGMYDAGSNPYLVFFSKGGSQAYWIFESTSVSGDIEFNDDVQLDGYMQLNSGYTYGTDDPSAAITAPVTGQLYFQIAT